MLIRTDEANSAKVYAALAGFGAPLEGITVADFRDHPDQIVQIGVEPSRIDILQSISGVTFEEAWAKRVEGRIDKDLTASFLGRDDLILNKETTGRPRDLGDVADLKALDSIRGERRERTISGGA